MYPLEIIEKYYSPDSKAFYFLIRHGKMVADKALVIARRVKRLGPDLKFIGEAAMLHDIGILVTDESSLGCYGDKPYICHGYAGRQILEKEGLPVHALVCERHVGAGISRADIREKNLPLPVRDMIPVSIEERIICFADKYFSKDEEFLLKEKPLEKVREGIAKFGQEQMERFEEWVKLFNR